MAKPKGYRSPEYEERRKRLLDALLEALATPKSEWISLRKLSEMAGVTPPTLKHYFGNREGLVSSLFEKAHKDAEEIYLEAIRNPKGSLAVSLEEYLNSFVAGWAYGLAQLHAIGLIEGIGHPNLGPAYLHYLLEPTLQSVERRLEVHQTRGELISCNLRQAALLLVSPIFLVLFHQYQLGGKTVRELDLNTFLKDHIAAFLKAYGPN